MYDCKKKLLQARGSIQQDELNPTERQAMTGEEEQAKITSYEEAFKRIKEATGVSDTQVSHAKLRTSHSGNFWVVSNYILIKWIVKWDHHQAQLFIFCTR